MEFDPNVRYLETHEWARKDDDEVIVGISDYAQSTLSDVVYVELPEVGEAISKGDQLGVVESVKAAGDVYAPMSGEVVAVNEALEDAPELVNQSPFGDGWLLRIKPSDPGEWDSLLDVKAYKKATEDEASE
ncbi:MAG: glycine cleavage system protein GcvH [Anaerolineae bacterium]|nr:glycine cleavage system protein GcvH [Anaerolineae bacterium]